ncbi:MAG: protein kinase [Myxococcales bacterium]|nr:protein kinase [Myxococcales bacterium]
MDLPRGTVVDDRYVVEEVIGRGGQGTVYRVHHKQLHSEHAMKVVLAPTQPMRARLLREGRAQAALKHPHIVAVTDVVTVESHTALVMEHVRGVDLEQFLNRGKPSVEHTDEIGTALISAMVAAHAHGVVHRDLKPENILLERVVGGAIPKITDFGLAFSLASTGRKTVTGAVMGTPQYMSPEQVRSAKTVDHRADIWALGAVLYELVTGYRAFDGEDVMTIWNKVERADYVPVGERAPDVPDRMRTAIERALQPDLTHRVPNATALLDLWQGRDPMAEESSLSRKRPKTAIDLDLDAAMAAVARRRSPPHPTGITLVAGAASLLMALAAGAVGLVVVAGMIWWSALPSEVSTVAATAPAREVVHTARPESQETPEEGPSVEVVPAPAPSPRTPQPTKRPPAPQLSGPALAAPAPGSVRSRPAPSSVAPKPSPAPEPTRALVRAEGAQAALQSVDGRRFALPAEVPLGSYRLLVTFDGRREVEYGGLMVEVASTGVHTVECTAGVGLCSVRAPGGTP